jgi:4-alpha-glucanotransferase
MSTRGASVPPFPPGYRASGVLLHITSLPSAYGIGDLGPAAFAWLDRLHEAGQRWWQALPPGPTGYGDSPYQSLSSFAGNELLISPEGLIDDGLLRAADCAGQGMRVLQFAFDGKTDNPYLPDNYVPNGVVYTGTHDNPTTRGWYEALSNTEQQTVWKYLGRSGGAASEVAPALLRLAWESVAALAIAPLQDLLNLGNEARMNVPGRAEGNWRWRCTEEMLSIRAFEWLRDLTKASGRSQGES